MCNQAENGICGRGGRHDEAWYVAVGSEWVRRIKAKSSPGSGA